VVVDYVSSDGLLSRDVEVDENGWHYVELDGGLRIGVDDEPQQVAKALGGRMPKFAATFHHRGHEMNEPCRCPGGPTGLVYKSVHGSGLLYKRVDGTPALRQAEAIAIAKVAAGQAPDATQALSQVWRENPKLGRAHWEERSGHKRKIAKRAAADAIYADVVVQAKRKVAAGQARDLNAGIADVWRENPGLYRKYYEARPR
jgi:hypothetical protein